MKNFIYIILAVFTFSCKKSSQDSGKSTDIIPLKIGNYWHYLDITFSEIDTMNYTRLYYNLEVTGTTQINNISFFNVKNDTSGKIQYYRNEDQNEMKISDGSKTIVVLKIVATDSTLIYSEPWLYNGCIGSRSIYGYRDTITINNHKCLKNVELYIDCSGNIIRKNIYFFTPGVGIIKVENYVVINLTGQLFFKSWQSLQGYHLN